MKTKSKHGDISRYAHGCRCDECRTANREAQRENLQLTAIDVSPELRARVRKLAKKHPSRSMKAVFSAAIERMLDALGAP